MEQPGPRRGPCCSAGLDDPDQQDFRRCVAGLSPGRERGTALPHRRHGWTWSTLAPGTPGRESTGPQAARSLGPHETLFPWTLGACGLGTGVDTGLALRSPSSGMARLRTGSTWLLSIVSAGHGWEAAQGACPTSVEATPSLSCPLLFPALHAVMVTASASQPVTLTDPPCPGEGALTTHLCCGPSCPLPTASMPLSPQPEWGTFPMGPSSPATSTHPEGPGGVGTRTLRVSHSSGALLVQTHPLPRGSTCPSGPGSPCRLQHRAALQAWLPPLPPAAQLWGPRHLPAGEPRGLCGLNSAMAWPAPCGLSSLLVPCPPGTQHRTRMPWAHEGQLPSEHGWALGEGRPDAAPGRSSCSITSHTLGQGGAAGRHCTIARCPSPPLGPAC